MEVFRRDLVKIYESIPVANQKLAKSEIIQERNVLWSTERKEDWERKINKLFKIIDLTGDKYNLLEEVLGLMELFRVRVLEIKI